MTQQHPDQPASPQTPPSKDPAEPLAPPSGAGAYGKPISAAPQFQQKPEASQDQRQSPAAQQSYPASPQYPGQYGQPPAAQQSYPASPQFQGQYPQMLPQPPMPYQAYGYPQPKSKLAAGLLGIFLGGLGIHRLYLGYTLIGILQLAATLILSIFTFGLVALWGVVEGIMILAGASYFQRDARGIPLRD
jgi:TM2 domain-containing membrane protein YozV